MSEQTPQVPIPEVSQVPELLGNQAGHGRLVSKDVNDSKYPLRFTRSPGITERYWWTPAAYDQGNTSQCVAYSGVRYLESGPIRNARINFLELYRQCQELDEWEGSDYDGTSVRALFKAFKARGLIGEYRWATDADSVIDHVLTAGPVVMGTLWSDEMSNPTLKGYITITEGLDRTTSGHAWTIYGASKVRRNPDGTIGAARARNSWGPKWGPDKGSFWVTKNDLDTLIKMEGEAGVASEIRI